MVEEFGQIAEGEELESDFALGYMYVEVKRGQFELEGAAIGFVVEGVGDFGNGLNSIDFGVEVDGAGEVDYEGFAMMGETGVEAGVGCNFRGVERDDLGGEMVVLGVFLALIDSDLEIEVRRFNASEAIFARVGKFPALVAKKAANVGVEAVGYCFDVVVSSPSNEGLCGGVVTIGHMMALEKAREFTHSSRDRADNPALA